jgi:hypothetical protein
MQENKFISKRRKEQPLQNSEAAVLHFYKE